MKLKILILGASGFVGYALFQPFTQKGGSEVLGTYFHHAIQNPEMMDEHEAHSHQKRGLKKSSENSSLVQLDVCSPTALGTLLRTYRPDAIINTIAMSSIDECEQNRERSTIINVHPTKMIVEYCIEEPQTKYVFFSSDHVYDGSKKSPYKETDKTGPVNHYGHTKLQAEQIIRNSLQNYAILRPCVLFAWTLPHQHQNLFTVIVNSLRKGVKFQAFCDKTRTPCYLPDAVLAVERIIALDQRGVFNLGGDPVTIDEFGTQIAQHFGFDPKLILPIKTSPEEKTRRPFNCALDNSHTEKTLSIKFHTLTDALQELQLASIQSQQH